MSRRFKGGICAYCGEPGETDDHVFARGFFPTDKRHGIPQVAACDHCNGEKSKLEHYLLTVLPFGGNHAEFPNLITQMLPRRLAGNVKLHKELATGRVPVNVIDGGVERETLAVPFDSDRYFDYFRFVTRGLSAYHWQCQIPASYVVSTGFLSAGQEEIMRSLFVKRSANYARGDLGDGLVLYEGQQAVDDPAITIWRFRLYGPMLFHGYEGKHTPLSWDVWATSAKQPMPGMSHG